MTPQRRPWSRPFCKQIKRLGAKYHDLDIPPISRLKHFSWLQSRWSEVKVEIFTISLERLEIDKNSNLLNLERGNFSYVNKTLPERGRKKFYPWKMAEEDRWGAHGHDTKVVARGLSVAIRFQWKPVRWPGNRAPRSLTIFPADGAIGDG